MVQRIKIHPQEVRRFANEIKRYNSQAKQMMRGVQQEVDEAQQVWKGNSAEAYARAFSDVRKDVENQMDSCLNELADALNKISSTMMQMEEDIAKNISVR